MPQNPVQHWPPQAGSPDGQAASALLLEAAGVLPGGAVPPVPPGKLCSALRKGRLVRGHPVQTWPGRGRQEGAGLGCDGGAGAGGPDGQALGNRVFIGRPASPWEPAALPPHPARSVRAPSGKLLETRSTNGCSGSTGKENSEGEDLMRPKAESLLKENLLLQ